MKKFISLILAITMLTSCASYTKMPVPTQPDSDQLVGKSVYIYTEDARIYMRVKSVDYPFIEGLPRRDTRAIEMFRVDLRDATRIEVVKPNTSTTLLVVIGGMFLIIVTIGIIDLAANGLYGDWQWQ